MKRVVITGMGAITPIGNSIDEVANSLFNGKCGIDYITRFDTTDYKVKVAAQVKDFDPNKFIKPSEVRRMDLYSQYALSAAMEAYNQSGLNENNIAPDRLGVYFGSGMGGVNEFSEQTEKLLQSGPKKVSPFFVPKLIANMASGLIAIETNAQGPVLPVVTACATGTHSIGEAFRAIKFGYADAILAGGGDAAITPISVAGFTNCMALTQNDDPLQASIPFDKRRNGFVLGEGAGVLVLEEYDHAIRRGANILAEVVGYGNTCDAYHMTAPEPSGIGATRAMTMAMTEAQIEPCQIDYINAHGTSTPLNDKIETMAIKAAFADHCSKLAISSIKSMTGHLLGAAGAIEAIACVLAIRNEMIPPTIGYKEFDPDCDLDIVPNTARKQRINYALSNSMGFGGHNASLIIKRFEG